MFPHASDGNEGAVTLSEGVIMRTPASIGGHPIHPMLIVFPVGLLLFSLVCDLLALSSSHPEDWTLVAFYSMVGGFIGALAAAIPGLIDLVSITDRRIERIAIMHMSLNLIAVALYAVNIWARYTRGNPQSLRSFLVSGRSGHPCRFRVAWWRDGSPSRCRRRNR
jgi:uncharacterized membrane protein